MLLRSGDDDRRFSASKSRALHSTCGHRTCTKGANPVTAFLSTGSKAAAFCVFLSCVHTYLRGHAVRAERRRVAHVAVSVTNALVVMARSDDDDWHLVAIVQSNIKRMLAYSSIAHAGYALIGIVAGDWRAVAFLPVSYVLINIGAFGVIELIARRATNASRLPTMPDRISVRWLVKRTVAVSVELAGIPLPADSWQNSSSQGRLGWRISRCWW